MPQSQDIHLDDSEIHKGPTARTAACPGKHLDACICCETCTRQAHASLGAHISCLPQMHAYSKVHAPVGMILTCCSQNHLQLGFLLFQRPILGVLLSQRSTLGVLLPQEPMNMFGQLSKNLL